MSIWNISRTSGNSVYYVVIWYFFPLFGMLNQEKSGNTDQQRGKHAFLSACHKLAIGETKM
jgi:hypothetical protein